MILFNANLRIYKVNQDMPPHRLVRSWWEQTLSSGDPVGLPWIVILAFIRICTNGRLFEKPLSPKAATAYVDEWLQQPSVTPVAPGKGHWTILRNLLTQAGTAGNLTSDAHIAALALERGLTVYSSDNDFKRFQGLRHVNPLSA